MSLRHGELLLVDFLFHRHPERSEGPHSEVFPLRVNMTTMRDTLSARHPERSEGPHSEVFPLRVNMTTMRARHPDAKGGILVVKKILGKRFEILNCSPSPSWANLLWGHET
jgi:hypothetical protein